MPVYSFFNSKTNQIKDIVMSMNDNHVYIDESGYQWERIWTKPQAAFDAKINNPLDSKEFVSKTGRKTGTIKDLWDQSKELSEKREKIMGRDEVKERYFDNYAKKRKGKQIEERRKQKLKDNLAKKGVDYEE